MGEPLTRRVKEASIHKDSRFHANRTSAGRGLLSNGFHRAPLLQSQRRTGGHLRGNELWVAVKRCNCVKARWKRSELKAPEPPRGNHTRAGDDLCVGELLISLHTDTGTGKNP